jgi:hypothetical protein
MLNSFRTRKQRIVWVASEKEEVCAEAARLLTTGLELSRIRAMDKAQKTVLPPHRHRFISGVNNIENLEELLDFAIRAKGRDPETMLKLPADPPTTAMGQALAKAAAEHRQEVVGQPPPPPPVQVLVPPPEPLGSYEAILDSMASTMAKAFVAKLKEHIQKGLQEAVVESFRQANDQLNHEVMQFKAAKPTVAKPRLPRVVVCSLLPEQQTLIERDFKDMIDVRCYTAGSDPTSLQAACKSSDVVIAMVGFIGHKHEEVMRSATPHDQFIRISGGMTSLREKLEEIYMETAK